MALPKGKYQVFISHATGEDGKLTNWLAEALDRLYIRAYVYERYQRGGQNRFETIKKMINECPYFLVILTKAGMLSQWVNQEIGYAVAIGKEPIPVLEVDNGILVRSKGFVELHDPVRFKRGDRIGLMAEILHTLVYLLDENKEWKDEYYFSCKCGHNFIGKLDFEELWYYWKERHEPQNYSWNCPKCKQKVTISFPDCHIVS